MNVHNLTVPQKPNTALPSTISREDDRTISIAFNGIREELGDVTIYRDRMPSGPRLEGLKARIGELSRWLAPAKPIEIKKELAKLFTMPHQNSGAMDGKLMAEVYLEDLGDLPLWAVSRACAAFRRGEAGQGHWAPSQAEIRRYAKLLMRRFEDERMKIEKVLNARVIDPPRF